MKYLVLFLHTIATSYQSEANSSTFGKRKYSTEGYGDSKVQKLVVNENEITTGTYQINGITYSFPIWKPSYHVGGANTSGGQNESIFLNTTNSSKSINESTEAHFMYDSYLSETSSNFFMGNESGVSSNYDLSYGLQSELDSTTQNELDETNYGLKDECSVLTVNNGFAIYDFPSYKKYIKKLLLSNCDLSVEDYKELLEELFLRHIKNKYSDRKKFDSSSYETLKEIALAAIDTGVNCSVLTDTLNLTLAGCITKNQKTISYDLVRHSFEEKIYKKYAFMDRVLPNVLLDSLKGLVQSEIDIDTQNLPIVPLIYNFLNNQDDEKLKQEASKKFVEYKKKVEKYLSIIWKERKYKLLNYEKDFFQKNFNSYATFLLSLFVTSWNGKFEQKVFKTEKLKFDNLLRRCSLFDSYIVSRKISDSNDKLVKFLENLRTD